jgi:multidrug efflux pump subunit AcrA (membrane-fusion protein)
MRKVSIVLAAAVLVVGVVLFRKLGTRPAEEAKQTPRQQQPVQFDSVATADMVLRQSFTGMVAATRRATVISEVTGRIHVPQGEVREGSRFSKGQVIFSIDDREPRMALVAQRSAFLSLITQQLADLSLDFPASAGKWERYVGTADERQPLDDLPEVTDPKERRFLTSKGVYDKFYGIRSAEARLDKFIVLAPFSGTMGKGTVTSGSNVVAGQQLGELIDPDSYEMETSVPARVAQSLKPGARAKVAKGSDTLQATVVRISDRVDPRTQMVGVFLSLPSAGLRDGEYLSGHIDFGTQASAAMVRQGQVLTDGTVLVVGPDSLLRAVPVQTVHADGDRLTITGLPARVAIVRSPSESMAPGTKVTPVR